MGKNQEKADRNQEKTGQSQAERSGNTLDSYFTTGEFARLCKVKKQTLFHYDDIGIFSPEVKKDNGYRYYSYNQLEVFRVISILKEMDMPLKSIKAYLDHRSPGDLIGLLENQITEIDRKLEDLSWLKNLLKTKVYLTRNALSVETGTVLTEELPEEEYLIITPYNDTDDDKKIAQAITEHLNYCHDLDIYSAYSIGGMIPADKIPTEQYYNYSHFYTKLNRDEYPAANGRKPVGRYAVIYHRGGFDTVYMDYSRLAEYIKAHGHTMGDYFYEDVILDELSMKGYENYVLKISIKII